MQFGLENFELENVRAIFLDLRPQLTRRKWIFVGGLPLRYYLAREGKRWSYPFNDIDIISSRETVLNPTVCEKFNVLHHHSAEKGSNFYFQLSHKDFPDITVDIFGDPVPEGQKSIEVTFCNYPVNIATKEEMYLFKLRDVLLLADSKRGLPPKHIAQLEILKDLADRSVIKHLWHIRHANNPEIESIYQYASLKNTEAAVEKSINKNKSNIREWMKSDPLKPCAECIQNPKFPLF